MKRYLVSIILFLSSLFLVSCAYHGNASPNSNLVEENWRSAVITNTDGWMKGASHWFLTGEPNSTEENNMHASQNAAISTMQVNVTDFNSIKINAPVQVELYGTTDKNSVHVYGPNAQVRQVAVDVRRGTLNITVAPNAEKVGGLSNVIVRIGVTNLNKLIQQGSGRIEGRQLYSDDLTVISSGCGNIYLAGNLRVHCISHSGKGMVSVFGATTPTLDVDNVGPGCVNVSGNVGIRSVVNRGTGNVNIVGANSDNLTIYADGRSKTSIYGQVNLRQVTARGRSCVFAYNVNSENVTACVYDYAHVGLAGCTRNLNVEASGSSKFEGRYLCSINAYARARNSAHINVTADKRIYASATESATVYFFGTPDLLSQFVRGNGAVIPIWFDGQRSCFINTVSYKGEETGERKYRKPKRFIPLKSEYVK